VSTKQPGTPCYLTILCQGATRATRLAAFPADDPLEVRESTTRIPRLTLPSDPARIVYTSPALCARETAAALNLAATPVPALGECDFGRWRGLRLHEVHADEPAALDIWFKDQSAAPHGGESLRSVGQRARRWLAGLPVQAGQIIAITNSIVIRHLMLIVLEAPPSGFWRIDVLPLSCVEFASNGARWALRTT
jgi:broad specificity phosphatase PhoE